MTDHFKDMLKKKLNGEKLQNFEEEEEEEDHRSMRKNQSGKLEGQKITLEKFLAIMQAIKNEKEIG